MPFLVSGPGYPEQEISPFTLPPDHKHHACHQSMPNNLERRGEVRGAESTETARGGSAQPAGHPVWWRGALESSMGGWSGSALEKRDWVNK